MWGFKFVFLIGLLAAGLVAETQVIPVSIRQEVNGNWQLYRNNEPYYIRGVGGQSHLEEAVAIGANSFRTWSPDQADELLDEAQRLGMTVMLGLWVQHERHGFDYNNTDKVKAQLEYFTQVVQRYKDHPALLLWGVGNEVDLFYTNTAVWDAVNDICAMIHDIDPNHPTVTVTAGLDATEVALIKEKAPHVDIYGINTYGDIGKVPSLIRSAGWQGPYIISEWGPNGHWEVPLTKWGAPVEQTSSEKAQSYTQRYTQFIAGDASLCLGSYVFLWGQKQETTSTWYGLFSEEGHLSEAIQQLAVLWGNTPPNQAPRLSEPTLNNQPLGADILVQAWQTCSASVQITDPDADKYKVHWEVVYESQDTKAGGDAESRPPAVKGLSMKKKGNEVWFSAPGDEGAYRLFCYIYDGQGHYAYANIPFYVQPLPANQTTPRAVSLKEKSW